MRIEKGQNDMQHYIIPAGEVGALVAAEPLFASWVQGSGGLEDIIITVDKRLPDHKTLAAQLEGAGLPIQPPTQEASGLHRQATHIIGGGLPEGAFFVDE